jgi:hypothetical protein
MWLKKQALLVHGDRLLYGRRRAFHVYDGFSGRNLAFNTSGKARLAG